MSSRCLPFRGTERMISAMAICDDRCAFDPIDPIDPLAPRLPLDMANVEAQIALRWQHWRPHVLLHLRKLYSDRLIDSVLNDYRSIHRRLDLQCLLLGLSWATIRMLELDDPRQSHAQLQSKIENAHWQHTRRMEREIKRRERAGEFHDRRR